MSIKGVIFDFDGTLFDSMSIWETAGADYLRSIGCDPEPTLHEKLAEMSLLQASDYLKVNYNLHISVKEVAEGINKTVEDFYFYYAKPKDNVVDTLAAFKAKGIRMCIATATDRRLIEGALSRCDMLHYFDAIFTCTEVGHGKDEPDIFERALSFLKMEKSETAVFEDACHAAKTAKNAGFFVVGVYDRYEKHSDALRELSDIYIHDFSELGGKK